MIIAFDTCCEAEQLFVAGGQLLSLLLVCSNLNRFTILTSCQIILSFLLLLLLLLLRRV